jgi:hypothetical protein
LAVFDVFSAGNYYINVIFYSFLTLAGPIAIYRIMADVFPDKKLTILLSTFLLPSFIYWTSGIHKDGLVFMGLALIIYCFYFGLQQKRFTLQRWAIIVASLLLILLLRNFLVLFLIPACVAWSLAHKYDKRPVLIFTAIYLLCTLIFFTAKYIHPDLDLPQSVVDRQQAFLTLTGGSAVAIDQLQPNTVSFIQNIPQAFLLSTIRPYPSDVRHILSLAAAAEINLLLLFFLIFLLWRQPEIRLKPVLLFCLFLSFSVLMSIGYTVHFLGAIVRYRSIVLPLLVIPMMASINWRKIQHFLLNNITNEKNV